MLSEPTLKNRPKPSDFKRGIMEDRMKEYIIADILWFEGFEKKHRDFVNGKIYDWLEANVPGWAAKGCQYMDLLVLFIEKEILGEKREV